MKKRFLSLLIGFLVSLTAVNVLHCGCLFAQVPETVSPDQGSLSHCARSEETAQAPEKKDCCGNCCSIGSAIFDQQAFVYKSTPAESVAPLLSNVASFDRFAFSPDFSSHRGRSPDDSAGHFSSQPIYILFESFLI